MARYSVAKTGRGSSPGDLERVEEGVDLGDDVGPVEMAAGHHVETEGAAGQGEEALQARLSREAVLEGVAVEVPGADSGHALAGEQRLSGRFRTVFEQGDEDVAGAHDVDRSRPEVGALRRKREVGEVRDRGPPHLGSG